MNNKYFFILGLILNFTVSDFYSQADNSILLKPDLRDGWEEWVKNRPVGGEIRVGLMTDNNLSLENPNSFFAAVPRTDLTILCVQIRSVDGRYSAHLEYKLPSNHTGITKFDFPSEYKRQLSDYQTSEISILAELKKECDQRTEYYVLTSWNDNFDSNNSVIYVNSRRPVKLLIVKNKKVIKEYQCKELIGKDKSTVSFNRSCKFPMNNLDPGSDIMIRQSGRGPVSSPIDYKVPVAVQ